MRFFLPLILAAALFGAQTCRWRVKDFSVGWEAYKTPLKIGVKGSFDAIRLSAKPQEKMDALLRGARMLIDTESVSTKNRTRDAKIVKYFFQAQGVDTIEAQILSVTDKLADVEITMHDTTRRVPMRLKRDGELITAQGVIDLADFGMLPALRSLTDACRKPHEGKTWQDVTLTFEMELEQKCR